MVSTCLVSKSFNSFNNSSVTVPRAPIIIGMNITFMFHGFFTSLARRLRDPFESQNLIGVCVFHSLGQMLGYAYTVFSYGQTSIFAQFQVDHHAHQSCLVLYSFCANLLHSLIMWLIIPSLSTHNLRLLFCCILSSLTLIWLVLFALFLGGWAKTYKRHYYLSTLPRPSISFTEERWNKSSKHTAYLKKP